MTPDKERLATAPEMFFLFVSGHGQPFKREPGVYTKEQVRDLAREWTARADTIGGLARAIPVEEYVTELEEELRNDQ